MRVLLYLSVENLWYVQVNIDDEWSVEEQKGCFDNTIAMRLL